MKNGFEWRQSDSGIYALIHYLRLKYSVGLPKSMQANVELLTPPDEIHDITEYELNNDRVHNVFFQVVIYDLKWLFIQKCYYKYNS